MKRINLTLLMIALCATFGCQSAPSDDGGMPPAQRIMDCFTTSRWEENDGGTRYYIQRYYPLADSGARCADAIGVKTIEFNDTAVCLTQGLDNPKFSLSTPDSFLLVSSNLATDEYFKLENGKISDLLNFITEAVRKYPPALIDSTGVKREQRGEAWVAKFKKEYNRSGVVLIPVVNPQERFYLVYPQHNFAPQEKQQNFRLSQMLLPPFLFTKEQYLKSFGGKH